MNKKYMNTELLNLFFIASNNIMSATHKKSISSERTECAIVALLNNINNLSSDAYSWITRRKWRIVQPKLGVLADEERETILDVYLIKNRQKSQNKENSLLFLHPGSTYFRKITDSFSNFKFFVCFLTFHFLLLILLLFQCRKSKKLLSRGHSELTVNVLIVILHGVFLNA